MNDECTPVTPASPTEGGPFTRVLPWVLLVSGMFFLNYLCRAVFGPLLPELEREFSITHAASTRLLLYISAGYTLGVFLSAGVAATFRPRFLVAASLVAGGILLQGVALAGNLFTLTAAMTLLGLAAGQYFNAGMSTIRSIVTPPQWSRAVAIHEFGPNAGFIFAPLIAEMGATHFGWRGTVSVLGWVGAAAGILFYFLGKGGEYPAAPVSLKNMRSMLKNRTLWLFTWFIGLAIAGQFGPFSVLTLHMTGDRAMQPDFAAFLLSASRVASPFGALAGGLLTVKLGTRRTLFFCLIVYSLALAAMSLPYFVPFVAGMFAQPFFTAMIFPPLFTVLAESFPLREQPVLLAMGMPVASFFGVGLMPGILGIFGDYATFNAGFLCMACLAAGSLLMLRGLPGGKNAAVSRKK